MRSVVTMCRSRYGCIVVKHNCGDATRFRQRRQSHHTPVGHLFGRTISLPGKEQIERLDATQSLIHPKAKRRDMDFEAQATRITTSKDNE